MMIKKPLFIDNKNLISFLLLPLTIITLIANYIKKFTKKKSII